MRSKTTLRFAGGCGLLLVALMFALGRLAAADPTVKLSRDLRDAGYRDASVVVLRGDGDAGRVVVKFDPQGQPPAAIDALSRRAAERVWTTGRVDASSISVQPRDGTNLDLTAAQLPGLGQPAAGRETYGQVTSRARMVVALAAIAVLCVFVLAAIASITAVRMARRGKQARLVATAEDS